MVRLSLLALLSTALPFALTHQPALYGRQATRGSCGFTPSPAFLTDVSAVAAQDAIDIAALTPAKRGGSTLSKRWNWPLPTQWIFVPTYFHVVAINNTLAGGYIPTEQLFDQYRVLNEGFAPYKIKFILLGISRTINPVWATDDNGTGNSKLAMQTALRRGDYKSYNVFFMAWLEEVNGWGALGWQPNPLPNATPGTDAFNLDGSRILYTTVPGGGEFWFDKGKTLTHEAGHWFGLLHTFQGDSCEGPGDYVEDTPQQSWGTEGCPVSSDTCPLLPGLDPIHNFMDYSKDSCMNEFTPLQVKRMFTMYHKYRNPSNSWKWW